MKKLAILAGRGPLPEKVAQSASKAGWGVVVIGFYGFAQPLTGQRWPYFTVKLGEVARILDILRDNHCRDIVMIGGVDRPNFFKLGTDRVALRLLRQWGRKLLGGDNQLLSLIVDFFQKSGFTVHGADRFLRETAALDGVLTSSRPDTQDAYDVQKGGVVLRAMGACDVGQACVVQHGVTLAVEAMEGTDSMIMRAASLRQPGRGGVLVKAAKPQQDTKVDMPVLGAKTIEEVWKASLTGIAFDPKTTLLIDPPFCCQLADRYHLFLWGRALTSMNA